MLRPAVCRLLVMGSVIVAAFAMVACDHSTDIAPEQSAPVTNFLGSGVEQGFAKVLSPRRFVFPADHGAHSEYRAEWWYFTGNLTDDNDRHFGFQLTFFRFAMSAEEPNRSSAWATSQSYMAHFAVTDTQNKVFYSDERLSRGALGLAGAVGLPFKVWLGDWVAEGGGRDMFPIRLHAVTARTAINLRLEPGKPLVLQGEAGFSRKGPEPGNASHYYSYSRLPVNGEIRIGDDNFAVTGSAWMDREWSTSALSENLAGWEWFALQLEDESELMFYRLRQNDGETNRFSAGSWIFPDGRHLKLTADDVVVEAKDTWRSPETNVVYPVAWSISIPSQGATFAIEPFLAQQELDLTVRYWEGAVNVTGHTRHGPVSGQGYLELTGYR